MSMSDMDATYFELEQAALEHSLRPFNQNDHESKKRASTSSTSSEHWRQDSPAVAAAPSAIPAVASLPSPTQAASIPPAAASIPPAASNRPPMSPEVYPSSVQELCMNGFALAEVVKVFDLVGDNFDDMLSLLLSNHK
jgi:hypothetical protein